MQLETYPEKVVQLRWNWARVDCVWIVCGLAIGALWLLTVNRGNQERMFRMRQSVNGRWARKI